MQKERVRNSSGIKSYIQLQLRKNTIYSGVPITIKNDSIIISMLLNVLFMLYYAIASVSATLFVIPYIYFAYVKYIYLQPLPYTGCQSQSIKYVYLSIYNLAWVSDMSSKYSGMIILLLAVGRSDFEHI